ncbi:sugar phosphate isomerase/epimerase family protein [Lysobacter capsici]|uniref:sugar phosphate isomerase/epimerase family protein n=1 Tax=Lysobacter capsici TaxID=435897 RepID=UPI00287B8A9C|nr:sugar phosphate isomerase/epimerase [Lysobacter capsici]WND83336.1 sugar phosphate isomerase/epimerase [Lysobacter capsici]WND88533.1 sugar phosphate isomerase/epimerase [Lysobacter capsici]
MIAIPRSIAAAALVLFSALPAFAQTTDAQAKPIAVQMYTLRNVASLEEQLKIVHDAGIHAVETVGTQNASAADLKRLLDKYSIQVVSTHVQLSDLRSDLDKVVAFNKSIGNSVLVVPYLKKEERPTDAAGWTALGKELGAISNKVRAKGMTLAYHNHDFEIVDFNGKTGLELMFEGAGPKLEAELDLAWIARAGYDPAALLGKFRGRVFAVHAKDNAPTGQAKEEDGFAALGKGVLNWNAILPASARAGVRWYIIEHDHPLDPAAVVKTGAAYLNEHLPAGAGR